MEELTPVSPEITLTPAQVSFPGYGKARIMAQDVADYINNLELTESNIKVVKKDLADARKVTKALSDRRIALKKEILAPFATVESQIKEICAIVDEADRKLRDKVRELDDKEREVKKNKCFEIWTKRYGAYELAQYVQTETAFESSWNPAWANKSISMKAVEEEMVEWLEGTEKDIETVKSLGDEYLTEYIGTMSVNLAIALVNDRKKRETAVQSAGSTTEKATFVIHGAKDIRLAEMLLKENDINFERR